MLPAGDLRTQALQMQMVNIENKQVFLWDIWMPNSTVLLKNVSFSKKCNITTRHVAQYTSSKDVADNYSLSALSSPLIPITP